MRTRTGISLAKSLALLVMLAFVPPAAAQSRPQVPATPGGIQRRFDTVRKRLRAAIAELEQAQADLNSEELDQAEKDADSASSDLAEAVERLQELADIAQSLIERFTNLNFFGVFDGVLAVLQEIRSQLDLLIQNLELFRTGELATLQESIEQAKLWAQLLQDEFKREREALPK